MATIIGLALRFADEQRIEHRQGVCGDVKAHCPFCIAKKNKPK